MIGDELTSHATPATDPSPSLFMKGRSALQHPHQDATNSGRARTFQRGWRFAVSLLAGVLLLGAPVSSEAAWSKRAVDFSNYETPLYEQIRSHIQVKMLERLGEGKNARDRYFIIPFAYQNKGNDPEFSHSFMTVIRVLADDKQPKLTPGIEKRTYKDRNFQAFTISWLPHDFLTNPNLCVFKGFGSRLFAKRNQCPLSVGHNFTLEESIQLAVQAKNAVCMWGPYEISKEAFDLVVGRLRLLESGAIKYRADDRLYRKDRVAINCFHAMAGLYELYPNGGLFGTGFKIWGFDGTGQVLKEYRDKSVAKGYLLEPVDVKNDRYGFVYAPAPDGRRIYNPLKVASAYKR